MTQRFTTDGGAELERKLDQWCVDFASDVRKIIPKSVLEAVVLGGGYGRGEGGVLRIDGREAPYNDLEFYIFVRGPLLWRERQFKKTLAELAHRWSEKTGIEFESKLLTFEKIQHAPVSMFYYDLVVGHRWIFGAAGEFQNCAHHRAAHRIPLHEATRLLMNRASGLLYSLLPDADANFIRRNIAKTQLALGDVVLTAFGRYHASCRERHRRLEKIEPATSALWLDELLRDHATGVEFKLHPYASTESREALRKEHAQILELTGKVFLWLEERRLGRSFASHREYSFSETRKHPDTRALRNALINLRAFGPRDVSARYPRERLLEALALLLWTPDAISDRVVLHKLQQELMTRETTFTGLVEAYRTIWSRFN